MGFHDNTRSLGDPSQIIAQSNLERELRHSQDSMSRYGSNVADGNVQVALRRYSRSVNNSSERLANMSAGGNGGDTNYRYTGGGTMAAPQYGYDPISSFVFSPKMVFFGIVFWAVLAHYHLQGQFLHLVGKVGPFALALGQGLIEFIKNATYNIQHISP